MVQVALTGQLCLHIYCCDRKLHWKWEYNELYSWDKILIFLVESRVKNCIFFLWGKIPILSQWICLEISSLASIGRLWILENEENKMGLSWANNVSMILAFSVSENTPPPSPTLLINSTLSIVLCLLMYFVYFDTMKWHPKNIKKVGSSRRLQ